MRTYALMLLCFVATVPSFSQWPITITEAIDIPQMVEGRFLEDGDGGAWVLGQSSFGDLYVTRLTREGTLVPNVPVSLGGFYDGQFAAGMFMSEDSCLIVGFTQYNYVDPFNPKMYGYLQKLDRNGNKLWPDGGVSVTLEESTNTIGGFSSIPEVCTDKQGGVYTAWLDLRHNEIFPAIYAQHVLADGTVAWVEGGISIIGYFNRDYNYIYPTPDSLFVTGGYDNSLHASIYYKVSAAGDTLFRLENLQDYRGSLVSIDDDHSYYYIDYNSDLGINVQKVAFDGELLWGQTGIQVARDDRRGITRNVFVDDTGGLFFSWIYRYSGAPPEIRGHYFQWINPQGEPYFDTEQFVSSNRTTLNYCQTDSNHITFVQNEIIGNTMRTFSQRISSDGVNEWADSTIVHLQSNHSNESFGPVNVSDGNGGQIIFLQHAFLKAKQVSRDGVIGDITVSVIPWSNPVFPETMICSIYPNPSNNDIVLTYSNYLEGEFEIEIYNLKGQLLLKRSIVNTNPDSESKIHINLNESRFHSGLFLLKIRNSKGQSTIAKFTLIR